MNLFHSHKHNWVKIKETYAKSYSEMGVNEITGEPDIEALFGLTTILWECTICQKLRKKEMLGKAVK